MSLFKQASPERKIIVKLSPVSHDTTVSHVVEVPDLLAKLGSSHFGIKILGELTRAKAGAGLGMENIVVENTQRLLNDGIVNGAEGAAVFRLLDRCREEGRGK